MKILFVLEHYYPYVGGAEKLFQSLAEQLAARPGYTVQVLTTRYNVQLPRTEKYHGVQIRRINCFNRFLFTLLAMPAAIQMAGAADLVITTSYSAALPAWLAARIRRKKCVIIFHEVWSRLWFKLPYLTLPHRWSFYLFEQFILRLGFTRFVAVSEFTRDSLIAHGIPAHKVTSIHNGLDYDDLRAYAHQPPTRFTATYLGRLGVSKGLDLLLPAAARFAQTHPDAVFKIILPLRPVAFLRTIQRQMHDLGLQAPNLVLLHELTRDELYREMSTSSCIVVPSYSEGFGFVAAEAVGLGIPLISSHLGALPEVVSGTYIGMQAQTVDALYEALCEAHEGRWQRTPQRLFHLQTTVDCYIRLIKEIMAAK